MEPKNTFKELSEVGVKSLVSKKGKFDYISWSDAWKALKQVCPEATYETHLNAAQMPFFYDPMSLSTGAFVRVSVKVQEQVQTINHPILDHNNRSIVVDKITVFDINRSIQRALTKAIALFGLGLDVFTGEDLPDDTSPSAPDSTGSLTRHPTTTASSNDSINSPDESDKPTSDLLLISIVGKGTRRNVFEIRDEVKGLGFKWNADRRLWVKRCSTEEVGSILNNDYMIERL